MLTAEQRDVQRLARDFAEQEIAPRAAAWDRDRAFDRTVLDQLAALGFLGMLVPEQYGGLGLDVPTYLVALEEIARADASVALVVAIQNGPVPHLLLELGTEEQRERWLPRLAAGEISAAFALPEDGAAIDEADASGLSTAARRGDDGGWTLSGTEPWVAGGAAAGVVAVLARTEAPGARARVAAFLVDAAAEGCRLGRREATMGYRASGTAPLRLDGVRLGPGRVLGDPDGGADGVLGALDLGRLGIGAQAVGIAQAAMEHATAYAIGRRQFGRALAKFGAVRAKLAWMAARTAASRALVMDAARRWRCEGGAAARRDRAARAAMAKLVASDTAAWVAEQAVHVLGGNGYMKEFPVEKLMRDAKGTEIFEGTSETMRLVIGRSLIERDGEEET